MKKLAVLLVRGSGKSGFKQIDKFICKVERDLRKQGLDPNDVCFKKVDWYPPIQNRQERLIEKLKAKGIKSFLLSNINDLMVYHGHPTLPSDSYEKTNEKIHQYVLEAKNETSDDAPIFIVSTSMGTSIVEDYVRDRQNGKAADPLGQSTFERFENLVGLYMLGSTQPLFAAVSELDKFPPVKFPDPKMKAAYKPLAKWASRYDKNDPFGFPLRVINDAYKTSALDEKQLNVGGIFTFWNAASHARYWPSKKIRKMIVGHLGKVLKTL